MTPRGCKRKGREYQNQCRSDFVEALQCHPDDLRCTLMSGAGMDIQVSPALRERFPFACECKHQASISFWDAMKQAIANTPGGMVPLLLVKRDGRHAGEDLAVLRRSDFLELVGRRSR